MAWEDLNNSFMTGFRNGQSISDAFEQRRNEREDRQRKQALEDEQKGDRQTARERATTEFGWKTDEQGWQSKDEAEKERQRARGIATELPVEDVTAAAKAKNQADIAKSGEEVAKAGDYESDHALDVQGKKLSNASTAANTAQSYEGIAASKQRRGLLEEDADVQRQARADTSAMAYLDDPASEWMDSPEMRQKAIMLRKVIRGDKPMTSQQMNDLMSFSTSLFRRELGQVPDGLNPRIAGAHFSKDHKNIVLELAYKDQNGQEVRGMLGKKKKGMALEDDTDEVYEIPAEDILHRFDAAAALAVGAEKWLENAPDVAPGTPVRQAMKSRLSASLAGATGVPATVGRGGTKAAPGWTQKTYNVGDEAITINVRPGEQVTPAMLEDPKRVVSRAPRRVGPDDPLAGAEGADGSVPEAGGKPAPAAESLTGADLQSFVSDARARAAKAGPVGSPAYKRALAEDLADLSDEQLQSLGIR